MNKISLRSTLFFGFLLVLMAATAASAQDFQKNYPLSNGGTVSIKNVSGDVTIKGYDGVGVAVAVYKEGTDRDKVDVEDLSSGNSVDLKARYPEHCQCNASLRFEVSIPRSLNIAVEKIRVASGNINVEGVNGHVGISSASGNLNVENVHGDVDASTASGEVNVRNITGAVNARSASGNVLAEIARLEGSRDMKFASASGDVNVKLPSNVDAEVTISTSTGNINTDFPLEVHKHEYGPGSQANGRLGSGAGNIKLTTASGNVSLTRQ